MKPVVLVMLSPPGQTGAITQAMAIQAHQPSVIVMIHISLSDKPTLFDTEKFLEAWIQGPNELMALHPNLDEPFPFPVTRPNGYISKSGKTPSIIHKYCNKEEIADTVVSLHGEYSMADIRFDYLPGAKFLKIPLLVDERLQDLNQTYTLESGGFIDFSDDSIDQNPPPHLSILDRCWLAGHPVHREDTWPKSPEWESFYDGIFQCLDIEIMNDDEKERLANRKQKLIPGKADFLARTVNRPIGFNVESVVSRLQNSGYIVEDNRPHSLVISSTQGLQWNVELMLQNIPSGLPLELLMANQLSIGWEFTELVQGFSIIENTAISRLDRFRSLLNTWKEDYHRQMKKGGSVSPTSKGQNFVEICNLHDFDYDTSLDDILSAEIIRRNQEDPDNQFSEENLPFIRICEIDCIILDDWGLSSFDSKGAKGPGWFDNPDQAAMQRPDFLRPEPYFSISCTDPPDDFSQQNVVHISRLHKGRQVLSNSNKHRWDPSQFIDGEEISRHWIEYKVKAKETHDEIRKKQEEDAQEEVKKLERKKQEIIEKIKILDPNFEADKLSLKKLNAHYKEQKKAQLEAEESPKIIEELLNLDSNLELENLNFSEMRKLLKNMKRPKRKRRNKKNPRNYPCPHCNKVCNGEDQLKEHVSAKHLKEEE